MSTEKRKDSDVPYVVIACGVFTVVLLIIDFTYKNFGGLFHSDSLWYGIPVILLHIALAYSWFQTIRFFNDPNKNYWRGLAIACAIGAAALIMFHRSEWLGKKEFEKTVEQNKRS